MRSVKKNKFNKLTLNRGSLKVKIYIKCNTLLLTTDLTALNVGWLFWVQRSFETVLQSISGRLPKRGRQRREKIDESKNVPNNAHPHILQAQEALKAGILADTYLGPLLYL